MSADHSLLIVGGGGFIGRRLAESARAAWKVHVADRSQQGSFSNTWRIDVTRVMDVRNICREVRPSLVVNLAAISDIDQCERNPSQARAVNVLGAENVAAECARLGARLVHFSSAAVFDGRKHGYREEDPPTPLSVYGQTKLEAEKRIKEIIPVAIVIRPALVLGFSRGQGTNATLNKWLDYWRKGKPVTASADEYRNPIDASTLAKIILFLAQHPQARGVYHVGALDAASRYEIAQRVALALGYPPTLVVAQNESPPDRAPRGRDHFLLTDRIREICHIALGTIDEVVRRSRDELTEG